LNVAPGIKFQISIKACAETLVTPWFAKGR